MKLSISIHRKGEAKTLAINSWAKVLLSLCMLGMPVSAGIYLGLQLSGGNVGLLLEHSIESLEAQLSEQRQELAKGRAEAEQKIQALTLKLAELQARLVRLDAAGEHLTNLAGLDPAELDFSARPAVGGPESTDQQSLMSTEVEAIFADLESRLKSREQQFSILETMLADRKLSQVNGLEGRPVTKGWISSRYGYRTDPFTGRKSWHGGMDFAGRKGSDVVAVAPGVVIAAGERAGYGNYVEIDHGEGYITRYGHNDENKVTVGDMVEKGQVIAAMGSSGRSTGPHVHFEVYKHGRAVDPSSYIRRTLR